MSESISTTCVQGGYRPGDGEPRQIPIYQSTTWKFDTSEHMGRLFDLEEAGYFYTRLANPTNDAVAAKIAELEGGTAGMLTSSGQAANFFAVFNIAGAGDHVVASSALYGGTYNLLGKRNILIDIPVFQKTEVLEYDTNPSAQLRYSSPAESSKILVIDINGAGCWLHFF